MPSSCQTAEFSVKLLGYNQWQIVGKKEKNCIHGANRERASPCAWETSSEDSWGEWPGQGMLLGNWMGDLMVKSKERKK